MKKGLMAIIGILLGFGCLVGMYFVFSDIGTENVDPIDPFATVALEDQTLRDSLYSVITTNDKFFGFYFKEKTTIDTISNEDMLVYVLENMVKEKNHNQEFYAGDFTPENVNPSAKIATQAEINTYIRTKFNVDKEFKLNDLKGIGEGSIPLNDVNECGKVNENYYCGNVSKSGGSLGVVNKLEKAEITNNQEYIYLFDKAMIYLEWEGMGLYKTNFNITSSGFSPSEEIYMCGIDNNCDPNKTMDDYFKEYESELHTFKHTFKKAPDGKYYWYSSEIVSE